MRVTDIAMIIVIVYPVAFIIIYGLSCIAQRELRSEKKAREARELIKEMREDLLKISQYPIAFVCEEARIIAREAWKKSKEYAE